MNGTDLFAVIVNACGLGGAVLGLAIMATLPRQPADRARASALAALLAIFAADMASSIFDLSPAAADRPGLVSIGLLLWPWIPVCLGLYVDALIGDARSPESGRWYSAIAIAGTIGFVLFITLPAAARLELANGRTTQPTPHLLLALAGVLAFFLLWIGSMLAIGVKTMRALGAHRRRMRELLSDVSAADLRWIDGFMLFIGVGMAIAVADALFGVVTGADFMNAPVSGLFEAGVVAGLVLFGVHQHRAVPGWADEPEIDGSATENGPEPRYARSSLTAADCAAIVARLDAAMRSDEPWRNPMLDLKTLSERIATRPYYVTQALPAVATSTTM